MQFFFIALTFISTFFGGVVGLKYRKHLHTILGFTAGVMLGVIAFDLFPEIISMVSTLGVNPMKPMLVLVLAFLIFHVVEKTVLIHHAHEEAYGPHTHPRVGMFQALALAGHSFLDGAAIGFGFQVSASVGVLVAIAVIAHDFSDGLNTVSLMLRHKNTPRRTLWFLLFDALAPVLGGITTLYFALSERQLLNYLAFFAGFLLYIGVSDILPEAHSKQSEWKTVFATLIGVAFMFAVVSLIGA